MIDYTEVRPLVGILWTRAMGDVEHIMPWIIAIAQRQWPVVNVPPNRTEVTRNVMAWTLMDNETDATHLVMLDLDHKHPLNTVDLLCRSVAEDPTREAVFGVAYRRSQPYEPMAFRKLPDGGGFAPVMDWKAGEVVEVDRAGTAACIIARSAFEKIPEPWFAYNYDFIKERHFPTEDIWFCERAQRAGVRLWLDSRIQTLHLGTAFIGRDVCQGYIDQFVKGQQQEA